MKKIVLFAFSFVLLIGLLLIALALLRPQLLPAWSSFLIRPLRNLAGSGVNAEVVARANPAVVIVMAKRAVTKDAALRDDEEVIDSETEPQQNTPESGDVQPLRGTGTGFVIDSTGFIVTNFHVVKDADRIKVKLTDGREHKAVLQGSDTETDLALLKIEANNLPVLALGDSDAMRVGDAVIAIGNPLDYAHSVTAGIISAKGRKVYNNAPFEEYLQTDAAINRGNSGGPLLNLAGEVVGVNTVIRVDGRGISFAVPSNVVKRVVSQLRVQGFVARGYLGLQPQGLTPEFREGLGLKSDVSGVLVVEVTLGKPAARAGIRSYDVLTKFDGKAIRTQDDFFTQVANTTPQREVEIEVLRGMETLRLKATLEQREDDPDVVRLASSSQLQQTQQPAARLGFVVRENTPDVQRALKVGDGKAEVTDGVIVSEVDPLGSAYDAGLQVGHVILEANRQAIHSREEFQKVVDSLKPGSVLVLRISAPHQRVVSLLAIRLE